MTDSPTAAPLRPLIPLGVAPSDPAPEAAPPVEAEPVIEAVQPVIEQPSAVAPTPEPAPAPAPVASSLDLVIYDGSNEVSALYADGDLVQVGPRPDVYAKALEIARIEAYPSDDFLLGQSLVEDAPVDVVAAATAPTLALVRQYTEVRRRAEALRREAAELEAEAAAMKTSLTPGRSA